VIAAADDQFTVGGAVILLGADARYGGPEIIASAQLLTPEVIAFIVRHSCGFVTVAMTATRCNELCLPALRWHCGLDDRLPVPAVAVDAAEGIGTGISATDRARTARLLADPHSTAADFSRPGHLVPVRAQSDSSTSTVTAGLRLCTETSLRKAVVRCELVKTNGGLLDDREAIEFADAHHLPVLHIRDLLSRAA